MISFYEDAKQIDLYFFSLSAEIAAEPVSPDVATIIFIFLFKSSASYISPMTCIAISLNAKVGPWYNSRRLILSIFLISTTSLVLKFEYALSSKDLILFF